MTVVFLSPIDEQILNETVTQRSNVSSERITAAPTEHSWLVWIQGPNHRSVHVLNQQSDILFSAHHPIRLRRFAHAELGESIQIAVPALGHSLTSYGCFGIHAQVKTLGAAEQIVDDNNYIDNVQRLLICTIPEYSKKSRASLHEILMVPKGLDPLLTVAAEEIISGAINTGTMARLNQLRSTPLAPAVVRALAAELLEHIDAGHSEDAEGPYILLLREIILSAEECLYVALKRLRNRIKVAEVDDRPSIAAINARSQELAPLIHTSLLDPQDLPESAESDYEWEFYVVLGPFDPEKATASLPRQLQLLRFLADTRDPALELVYRAGTRIDPVTDLPNVTFEIIVRYSRTANPEDLAGTRRKAQMLSMMLHSVFNESYSFSYGYEQPILPRSQWTKKDNNSESVSLVPSRALSGWPDWGLYLTLTHEVESETLFEMILTAMSEHLDAEIPGDSDTSFVDELIGNINESARKLQMRAILTAKSDDLETFLNVVGDQFGLVVDSDQSTIALKPALALARFHPPFRNLPTYGSPPPLRLTIQEAAFPAAGVELGEVQIRLSHDLAKRGSPIRETGTD